MKFFEYQHSARRTTSHLLLAFMLTLALMVVAVNAAMWLVVWLVLGGVAGADYIPRYFFETNTAFTLLFVLGGWWIESSHLHQGGEAIARRAGARELRPQRYPPEQQLLHIVQEMAIAAHVPPPTVMVLPRQSDINAFAAGLEPRQAAIAVTDGALDTLSREELQGMVAHELSHIVEGDTQLNTQLIGMVFGLEMIFRFGQSLKDITNSQGKTTALALVGIPLMLVGSIGWLAGRLLCAAVSRQREYLADARAVQWTRNPHGLGGVLTKIIRQQLVAQAWNRRLYDADDANDDDDPFGSFGTTQRQRMLAHLMLSEPTHRSPWAQRMHALLSSHPPLKERIRRIYGRAQ